VNWVKLTLDRVQCWAVVNTTINFSGFIKGGKFRDKLSDISCSGRTLLICGGN
jgi:hypothetical protein